MLACKPDPKQPQCSVKIIDYFSCKSLCTQCFTLVTGTKTRSLFPQTFKDSENHKHLRLCLRMNILISPATWLFWCFSAFRQHLGSISGSLVVYSPLKYSWCCGARNVNSQNNLKSSLGNTESRKSLNRTPSWLPTESTNIIFPLTNSFSDMHLLLPWFLLHTLYTILTHRQTTISQFAAGLLV